MYIKECKIVDSEEHDYPVILYSIIKQQMYIKECK